MIERTRPLVHTDPPEPPLAEVAHQQPAAGTRRKVLGAGLIGLAGSLMPGLAGSARATVPEDPSGETTPKDPADDPTTTSDGTAPSTSSADADDDTIDTVVRDEPAATTTTAAPQRPTDDDVDLLSFAQSVELAMVELYASAMAGGKLSDEVGNVVAAVHKAHVSYGQSLNALLGRQATGESLVDLLNGSGAGFRGTEDDVLAAAYELEDTAVATHSELIGQLSGVDGAELLASIITAEARHSLVFADLAGETDLDALIFTAAEAIEPGKG